MRISLKQYRWIRIGIVIIISILISQSLIRNNQILPFITIICWWLMLWFCRSKVTEIIADERDYMLWGKSAALTIKIFSLIVAVGILFLYLMKGYNPSYLPIAFALSSMLCVMLLIYSCIFTYYATSSFWNSKLLLLILILVITLLWSIRLISGEDTRICRDGQWIAHGHPDFPMPSVPCTGAQLP